MSTDRKDDIKPISAGDPINPNYYKLTVENEQGESLDCQVVNILEAVGLQNDFYTATGVIYLLRAGRKEGNDRTQDIEKAIWWIQRGLDRAQKVPT